MLHNGTSLSYLHHVSKISLIESPKVLYWNLKQAKMLPDSHSMTILANYRTTGLRLHQSPYDVEMCF